MAWLLNKLNLLPLGCVTLLAAQDSAFDAIVNQLDHAGINLDFSAETVNASAVYVLQNLVRGRDAGQWKYLSLSVIV